MNRSVLLTLSLALISSTAVGQTSNYGPAGISPTIPILQISPIVVTPTAATIPSAPPVTPVIITPPVTTIPITQAVPPPIEPSPTERLENAMKNAYSSSTAPAERANGSFFNAGVTEGAPKPDDGTQGRSLGEIARAQRPCTPNVTGHTFSNEDFERTAAVGGASGIPTLVVNACPAGK